MTNPLDPIPPDGSLDVPDPLNLRTEDLRTEDAMASMAPRRFMVGIGASAGGLEALSALVSRLPPNLGASYVIVQHMSPTHRSMLVQLISRETGMPVSEIVQGCLPEADQIYITPPNRNVVLQDGRLTLLEPAAETVPKPSVNAFLTSLAEERGEDSIAVILSGTGSDGAVGVRAVKASGGLVFAQDTDSAKYSGMPQSAIDTECVDWIMRPEQIAAEIEVIVRAQGAISLPAHTGEAPATLRTLLQRVMRHARVDFTGYKESTVWRRILRRMVSNRVHTLEDYLALTEKNPEELHQLCKEILISVTAFFRDTKAFESLRPLLADVLQSKSPGDEIRVWVAGCATGEEAYSIAILISELLGPRANEFQLQIFATDIDLSAMAVARRGIYPEASLAEMDENLLRRYFVRREGAFEINKLIRDMVVFARQDLAQDPPFLRLDLITCRNVLIYFQASLQDHVLGTFHFALRPGGLLFLGKSETAHQRDGLFESVSREGKIFRRIAGESRLPTHGNSAGALTTDIRTPLPRGRGHGQSLDELLFKAVLDAALPPSVVVTPQMDIRHVFGDVSSFLNIPAGRPDFNLLNLVRPEWRVDAQTLTYQAVQRRLPMSGHLRGTLEGIRLVVRPLKFKLATSEDAFLVSFEPHPVQGGQRTEGEDVPDGDHSLQEELSATREHLQMVVEELETSNEETQALNEELQASNEELQASNEELQASNEELQSTNEELTTVNEELQIKTAELADTNADLENIQNSVGFVILVANDQMRLVRYNAAAARWLHLSVGSLGDNLRGLPNINQYPAILSAVEQVLADRRSLEMQLSHEGRHFILRVTPRLMPPREPMGAIISLSDESELIETQKRLRESEQRLLAIMNHSATAVAVKDMSGRYEYVNPRFCELFGVTVEQVLGLTDRQIFPDLLANLLRERDIDALKADAVQEQTESLPLPGGERAFFSIRFPLRGEDGVNYATCTKFIEPGRLGHDN